MEALDIVNRMIDDGTKLQAALKTGQGVGMAAEIQHKLVQLRIALKAFPQDSQTGAPTR